MGERERGGARTGMTSWPIPSPGRSPMRRWRVAMSAEEDGSGCGERVSSKWTDVGGERISRKLMARCGGDEAALAGSRWSCLGYGG